MENRPLYYRNPPAKPDPKTGWKAGDGKTWSMDLPWTDTAPSWWTETSENGEKDAEINLDTAWEVNRINKGFATPKSDTISITPASLMSAE